ncbi:hypothetical protein [Thomasclavelia cocleata]|uniref:hypothetical protein n=1 Tax=Thomasclavelia cocleata TaxID=69824 RepID=UPI00256F3994|nr:hypothetical protein [Thomasclavelia cocleata]
MDRLNYYMIFVLYHKDPDIESFMVKKTPLSLSVMKERFPEIFAKISKDTIRNIQPLTKEQFEAIGEVDYFACEKSMQLKYEQKKKEEAQKQREQRKQMMLGVFSKICSAISEKLH